MNVISFVSKHARAGQRQLLSLSRRRFSGTAAPLSLVLLLACSPAGAQSGTEIRLPDGAVYHGETQHGRLQGEGRLDWPNGNWLRANFKDGLANDQGEHHLVTGTHYQGSFQAGLYEGKGVLTTPAGRYEGQFHQGLFHGKGFLESADGWRYQGEFVKGVMQGEGSRTDSDGSEYSGTFRNGQLNGQGQWADLEGNFYEGGFIDSLFSGKGRYQSADGSIWVGTFKRGELTGQGTFTGADGSRYSGVFKNWLYHGQGRFTDAEGRLYIGHFIEGKFDGHGVLTYPDGRREAGLWSEGQRLRNEHGVYQPDPLERGLLEQGQRLDQALASVLPSTAGIELYGISLGGDGQQKVFQREADYVADLLTGRFKARSVIRLINQRDPLAANPLATRENLHQAIQTLAERSGNEDLIVLYLTSHGSADHRLALSEPGLELANLPATELAALLTPLKQRDKVVIVSACYSGGFIPPLKDEHTLVMTAARADRTSFGCTDEADFTYFGRALFAEAFQKTDDLQKAFTEASNIVAEREVSQGFEPSEPQIWAPPAVLKKWRLLRAAQDEHVALSTPET
ncbi:hypothetical protein IQ22_03551 [Pseudomonas duriflava]|uniref:Caspase family p20 domain-containing protein n=1 Tax=Pseudomonas duriflava TaxID=459528 RepID=A0A562Q6P4_9PSED|nr:hypothetical protein IQ22_03551 [Pseudomonas duriflava]